ncbi:MAG: YihY/virulence factor BrkB family protein [Bacteroidales bacterium]|nr:YihY/virulence factor BrkB family protein [Candidatus Cacconaster merdequi]
MNLFFARIRDFVASLVKFLSHDLWELDFSEIGKSRARYAKHLQAVILTIKGFTRNRVGREAVALSFFSTMAAVPMVAAILFVSNGFGLDKVLADMLYRSFPTSTELIGVILNMAHNIVSATENGVFGWISFISFIWLVFWLMINIETSFNRIWKVNRQRKIWKRLIVYVTVLLISPFVLLIFLFGWGWYAKFIGLLSGRLGVFNFLTKNIFWLVFYGVVAMVLSVMYKVIPHTKVRYGSALSASLMAGVAFVILQYLYMGTQMMVTRISAVYGVLAFIPLFMVWMNLCWQVILIGAELSRAFNQLDEWEIIERDRVKAAEKKIKLMEAQ